MKPKPKMVTGLSFSIGRTPGSPLPVDLVLKQNGYVFNTHWTCDDAEGIACSLLKQVELLRRWEAEKKKLTQVSLQVSP